MQFSQVIREPVEALLNYIEGEGKVRIVEQETKYGFVRAFVIGSSKPYYRLKELGVKGVLRQDIYESKHFWRGLLDGDGSIGMTKNQGKDYPVVAWSGNHQDMVKCSEWVASLGLRQPKVGACRSIFRVGLNGEPAAYLAKLLYAGEYSANSEKQARAALAASWRVKHAYMSRLTGPQRAFLLS